MLNKLRLILLTSVMGFFIVACGEQSAPEQAVSEETPAEMPATAAADMTTEEGMTEEAAIAKFGEPTIKQSRSIDALTITHMEWATAEGTTSIQFQNGVAKYQQFIPAE